MHRISAGLAAGLAAVVIIGCGDVPASHPGSATAAAVPARAADHGRTTGAVARGTAAASPGCPGAAAAGPTAGILVITLAGNEKTYCVRVGDKLRVDLRGTVSSHWQRPLLIGTAVMPAPGAGPPKAGGVTSASFAAVHPGHVIVVSIRPPCRIAQVLGKGDAEPAFPRIYPVPSCSPGHRFTASVIVLR